MGKEEEKEAGTERKGIFLHHKIIFIGNNPMLSCCTHTQSPPTALGSSHTVSQLRSLFILSGHFGPGRECVQVSRRAGGERSERMAAEEDRSERR